MTVRVRMTQRDLDRVRFASAPAPLLEATLAVSQHQHCSRLRTPTSARLNPTVRPLFKLIRNGRGPFFLDPLVDDPDWGFELVEAASRMTVVHELSRLWTKPVKPPLWMRNLVDEQSHERQVVNAALRDWYDTNIAPRAESITQAFQAEVAKRLPVLRHGGAAAILNQLHPAIRYHDGVVELPHALPIDVTPGGAGIELMPTTSWSGHPLYTMDNDRHVLVYPVPLGTGQTLSRVSEKAVERLLGPTRAMILIMLRMPMSTGELARQAGVSASSVSQHAAVLREAGLISSTRAGQSVIHAITPLGIALLGSVYHGWTL